MIEASLWTASINLLIAFLLLIWKHPFSIKGVLLLTLCFLFIGGNAYFAPRIEQWNLKNFYYNRPRFEVSKEGIQWPRPVGALRLFEFLNHLKTVTRIRTPYQNIDYVPDEHIPGEFKLYLDGHYQFDTLRERSYHEIMGQSPLTILEKSPQRILVLGGGDGLLIRELLKVESIKSIELIELDRQIIEQAKQEPLRKINQEALFHKKVNIVVEDALKWLRTHDSKFDAIYADFPYPYDQNSLRLYSYEFYKLIYKRLHDDGFLIADYPLDAFRSEKKKSTTYKTLNLAGFKKIWWLQSESESFLMMTKKSSKLKKIFGGVYAEDLQETREGAEIHSVLKAGSFMAPDPFF